MDLIDCGALGIKDGNNECRPEGSVDASTVGSNEGYVEGNSECLEEGFKLGCKLGSVEG